MHDRCWCLNSNTICSAENLEIRREEFAALLALQTGYTVEKGRAEVPDGHASHS